MATRNIRVSQGISSITPVNLKRTIELLQLRPRRLVDAAQDAGELGEVSIREVRPRS